MIEPRFAKRGTATLLCICAGLALRRYGYDVGLPFIVVKYGGSLLWGAMVFFLLAGLSGSPRIGRLAVAAMILAAAVEFSRLSHTTELDAFRLTPAGRLILGRVFSLWNLVAYAFGIGFAAFCQRRVVRRERRSSV